MCVGSASSFLPSILFGVSIYISPVQYKPLSELSLYKVCTLQANALLVPPPQEEEESEAEARFSSPLRSVRMYMHFYNSRFPNFSPLSPLSTKHLSSLSLLLPLYTPPSLPPSLYQVDKVIENDNTIAKHPTNTNPTCTTLILTVVVPQNKHKCTSVGNINPSGKLPTVPINDTK